MAASVLGAWAGGRLPAAQAQQDWRSLLPDYHRSARSNIVTVNGRRALLSARLYPGIYVRDALFWGPLALEDPELGYECYRWFADSQLESGQIRSAVPLHGHESVGLVPRDDEGTLLFIIASDWLRRAGFSLDERRIVRAYEWVQTHISDHTYLSPPGPFRYWADTVDFDREEAVAYNQGLLCLALRALLSLGLGGVRGGDVVVAQARYQAFYDAAQGYYTLGQRSAFAAAQDLSALFPEFLSRCLYGEAMLPDATIASHVARLLSNAAVYYPDGRLAGIKVISAPSGDFLPAGWFHAPDLNQPGDYQNGGHWPLFSGVALALAYSATGDNLYERLLGQLVIGELGVDHRSKEVIRLTPGRAGTFDPARVDYTWNALIRTACVWSGLAAG